MLDIDTRTVIGAHIRPMRLITIERLRMNWNIFGNQYPRKVPHIGKNLHDLVIGKMLEHLTN